MLNKQVISLQTKSVQLNVQKREKQYLIEDDPNEGPEQKRDERQSTPAKNNHNLDIKGNSRIINIRMQPTPAILTSPKQAIKPGPQRIPTKIPVILKTAKVVPGPAHALRMKMLENRINETRCEANKENTTSPNTAPPMAAKDNRPYFTIEDKTALRSESSSSSNNVDDEKPDLGSNETLNRDGKEILGNDRENSQNKDSSASQNEGKNDQVASNSERKATIQKPVHFFVDEPEPLPPSFRRQQKYENMASPGLEVTPSKVKEMPIVKKSGNKPKTIETRRKSNENDDDNDPDIVKISNGTHLISIKKIKNYEGYKNARDGYEITVPTEERIINQPPPKLKLEKPVDEPDKLSFTVTEKSNGGRHHNQDLTGLAFRDSKNKEENSK